MYTYAAAAFLFYFSFLLGTVMATYYEYYSSHLPNEAPSGTYSVFGNDLTVSAEVTWTDTFGLANSMVNLSGDAAAIALWEGAQGYAWMNGAKRLDSSTSDWDIIIFDVGLSGVSGIGQESPLIAGRYVVKSSDLDGNTYTPTKTDYTFEPASFTFDSAFGHGAHVTMVGSTPSVDLIYPGNGLTNVYLNKDWLQNFLWEDDDPFGLDDYTVYFDGVAQTDRSRYSIIVFKLNLGVTHEYETTYEWFVRKDLGGGDYLDSDTWSFTTLTFEPPTYSTRDIGGGETAPTGENNMLTVRRLIVAARNRIYYEDI